MRNCAQIGIDDEIFVDSFAGGGGASTGMEVGLGITVAAAINHDPAGVPWAVRGSRPTASISARLRAQLSLIRKSVALRGSP